MISNNPDMSVLEGLSEEEKKLAIQILQQLSEDGTSEILDDLKYSDFEEIPVDIDTFLDDDDYLGKGLWETDIFTGNRRCTVFPYWRETLKKLFPDNVSTAYNTLVLTGAIGIGKSFVGVLAMLYLLYRMLCLKDPYAYYGMQPIDKITFAMLNITLDAAQGVAWDKAQQMIQSSPWFMAHGEMNASRSNPQWQPPKGIELIFGSNNRHIVGRALFCLDGETEIVTTNGVAQLKDLVDKPIQVISIDDGGNKVASDICTVKPTVRTTEEYQIELEDGTIIHCTPNHRFMLKDGTYKEAQFLTEDDELAKVSSTLSFKESINLIDKQEYIEFFKTHTDHEVEKQFNITKKIRTKLKAYWQIPNRTREELKQISLRLYGTESPVQSSAAKLKRKNTCLTKYGTSYNLQATEVKQKIRETNIAKYGVSCTLQDPTIKEKAKQTLINNYGVDSPLRANSIKQQVKNTCQLKYGTDNPMQNEVIKGKAKATCKRKYGFENPGQADEIKAKIASSNTQHFGVPCSFMATEIKEKIKQSNIEKYGVNNFAKTELYLEKAYNTKKQNNSFHTSSPEELLYIYLIDLFGADEIIRQYKDSRYPYACDFYIKHLDMFIELNLHWTHGGHAFNKNNEMDILQLQYWQDRAATSDFYKGAVNVWANKDPEKLIAATKNKLNYTVIYNEVELDMFKETLQKVRLSNEN